MIKILRRNVLLNLGKIMDKASKDSAIYRPDEAHCVDKKGTIVSVADRCRHFTKKDIGKVIAIKVVKGGDRMWNPKVSKSYGLDETYHLLAMEDYLIAEIE